MPASTVDLVFVIDASESMRPCFRGLARNLDRVIRPLQGINLKVRLGLVALSVGAGDGGSRVYPTQTLAGGWDSVYNAQGVCRDLFTRDSEAFSSCLRSVSLQGDENNLVALDFALDFPFGPVASHRRVVAMFSDEKIEDGAVSKEELATLPRLIEKAMARKVMLFAAMPFSPALEALGSLDGSQFERVDGGDGLASVDFAKLLGQMAKSISVASVQGAEATYTRALFGQDRWVTCNSASYAGLR